MEYGLILPFTGVSGHLEIGIENIRSYKGFSREYKYTLGRDMKRDGIELVRSIYWANKSRDKKEYLEEYTATSSIS